MSNPATIRHKVRVTKWPTIYTLTMHAYDNRDTVTQVKSYMYLDTFKRQGNKVYSLVQTRKRSIPQTHISINIYCMFL